MKLNKDQLKEYVKYLEEFEYDKPEFPDPMSYKEFCECDMEKHGECLQH